MAAAILLSPFSLGLVLLVFSSIYADVTNLFVADGVGHMAHIGGYVSIGFLIMFLPKEIREGVKKGFWINVIVFLIGIGIYLFYG